MEVIKTKYGVMDLAPDFKEECIEKYRDGICKVPESQLEDTTVRILAFAIKDGIDFIAMEGFPRPKNIRVLRAHGDSENGTFFYDDCIENNGEYPKVQDWVNLHDGVYDALLVYACNPEPAKLQSQHSFLVYPVRNTNTEDLNHAVHLLEDNGVFIVRPPDAYQGKRSQLTPTEKMRLLNPSINFS